ncbi:hypothetical protein C8J57DRAFT_1510026 [Mycena rebaudengoi]|nr:hypothetical protein C8J57DRAFT_1510026 [Mycena rebaudengoi]
MRLPVEVWWRAVIVGSPIFWRRLEIGSASCPGWVSVALDRCNNRSISLCLHITSSRNFTAAARSKAVTLADPSSLEAFRELVAGSRLPRLGVLLLRVVVDGTGSTRLIPIFRYLEDTVFSDLVTSRSRYMGLAWSRNVTTCNLHTLVFRGLGPHFRLSWSDYRHIFKYTPCLQRLCLRNISCHSAALELDVFAALEELHELDVAFTSDMTLSDLLKSICAPHLRVLRFAGRHLGLDIVSLADCVDLLATVTRLDWTVGDNGIGPYSRLFMSLPPIEGARGAGRHRPTCSKYAASNAEAFARRRARVSTSKGRRAAVPVAALSLPHRPETPPPPPLTAAGRPRRDYRVPIRIPTRVALVRFEHILPKPPASLPVAPERGGMCSSDSAWWCVWSIVLHRVRLRHRVGSHRRLCTPSPCLSAGDVLLRPFVALPPRNLPTVRPSLGTPLWR